MAGYNRPMSIVFDYEFSADAAIDQRHAKATVVLTARIAVGDAFAPDQGEGSSEQLRQQADAAYQHITLEQLAAERADMRELAAGLSECKRQELATLLVGPAAQPAPAAAPTQLPAAEVLAVTTDLGAAVLLHRLTAIAAYHQPGPIQGVEVYEAQVRQQIRDLAAGQPPEVRLRLEQLFRLRAEGS